MPELTGPAKIAAHVVAAAFFVSLLGAPFSLTRVSYKDLVEQHLPRTHVLLF